MAEPPELSEAPVILTPPCVHHPDRAAAWFCPACEAGLCEDCVRVYPAREMDFASCKRCGGRCRAILSGAAAQRDPELAKASREERDRREERRINLVLAPIIFAAGFLLHLGVIAADSGILTGLLAAAAWAAVGTAGAALAWFLLDHFTGVGFDPPGATVWRLAAITVAVQALRALALWIADPQVPESGGYIAAFSAVFTAAVFGVCVILIPLAALFPLTRSLLDLDGTETVWAAVALLAALLGTFMLMIGYGAPT